MRLPDARFLHRLADAADIETLRRFRTRLHVETKPKAGWDFDPVTEADREAERVLRSLITETFPEHAVLGEEFGLSGDGPIRWVLDPIDGTRPFLCGIPVWGTLIGVEIDGKAELGMLSQPFTDERFWADQEVAYGRKGQDTYVLRVRDPGSLSSAILHTTSPEPFDDAVKDNFDQLTKSVRMTRYGGECYAFAMLAAGQIDLCVELSLQPYDIAAIIPIIERAGGIITTFAGERPEAGGNVVAASTAAIHKAALSILNQTTTIR